MMLPSAEHRNPGMDTTPHTRVISRTVYPDARVQHSGDWRTERSPPARWWGALSAQARRRPIAARPRLIVVFLPET